MKIFSILFYLTVIVGCVFAICGELHDYGVCGLMALLLYHCANQIEEWWRL